MSRLEFLLLIGLKSYFIASDFSGISTLCLRDVVVIVYELFVGINCRVTGSIAKIGYSD